MGKKNHQLLINLQMKQNQSNSTQTAQSQNPSFKLDFPSSNPRKAATKLKEVNLHIEIMRNRFKSLQVQQGYHRYRTIDQQKRINLHNSIHQTIKQEREQLKKQIDKLRDTTELKEKNQLIKTKIRQSLEEAKKTLQGKRIQRTLSIYSQGIQHDQKIKQNLQRQLQQNRQKSILVKTQEQQKRQSVSRHMQQRKKSIRLNKCVDSQTLNKEKEKKQLQLSRLMKYEQELLKKNSQSLQASQVMKNKFDQLFHVSNVYNASLVSPRMLPEIKPKTNSFKQARKTQVVII